jgi:hypothetical protein
MELLLTRRQIEAVSDMTAGGRSKLEAIRELINWGIAFRELINWGIAEVEPWRQHPHQDGASATMLAPRCLR